MYGVYIYGEIAYIYIYCRQSLHVVASPLREVFSCHHNEIKPCAPSQRKAPMVVSFSFGWGGGGGGLALAPRSFGRRRESLRWGGGGQ